MTWDIRKSLVLLFCAFIVQISTAQTYSWNPTNTQNDILSKRFVVPEGYERLEASEGSYPHWLRNLPLMSGNPSVKLYDGSLKGNQTAHLAVVNIDIGDENLQQCADAVMRLRAEYLYSVKRYTDIHFNYTSGDNASYVQWAEGVRPVIKGNKVSWVKSGKKDYSYAGFKNYLKSVFMYAGTLSLEKELKFKSVSDIMPGDVLIKGGTPGHAVLVVDVAVDKKTGKRIFMLAQSYMPAQNIQILRNPLNPFSVWYEANEKSEYILTPEWEFSVKQVKYFP